MEEAITARYWCYMCSQIVNPIMEVEVKCPFCRSGFVEEMSNTAAPATGGDNQHTTDSDFGSDRALSLWAPILLGMMDSPRRRRRFRQRLEFEEDEDDDRNNDDEAHLGRDTELDRELESIIRRRRRSSATILQLLQGIRAGLASESSSGNPESDNQDRERDRERERVVLINPFNQTIIVQGSYSSEQGNNDNNNSPLGSLGDYFIGPGLDLLLQHLAENDPNRYGTPPAQKEAIDALPTVAISENLQCSVCLDDFDVGAEAKEMPCKHKFHGGCILPWLELHSSCPVCRFQLPADESKRDSDGTRNSRNTQSDNGSGQQGSGEEVDGEGRNAGRGRRFTFPWPFNGLFSSSTPSSSSNANAGGDASESDDN